MTSDDMLKNLFKNDREMFLETLGSYTLVDIGTIESVDENGRARVLTNQYIANERVIYQDVEVIYPGNPWGAYTAECSGTACLILFPYMCMPNTDTRMIRPGATPYNKDGVKAMPIGNGSKSIVKHFINSAGEYSLGTTLYNIAFDGQTISLTQGDVLSLSKDAGGNLYARHKNKNSGTFLFRLDEDGMLRSYTSLDGSVVWEDSIGTDGVRTFTQKDSQANVLNSITIDASGAISISSSHALSITTEDDLTLKGKNVIINSTGDNSSVNVNNGNLKVDK